MATDVKEAGRKPKRIRREVQKQVENIGIGTKSKQALDLQQEQMKTERKAMSREQREVEKERSFELRQQKRKEKHNKPHVHALYGDNEIVVGIDGKILEGNFPNKQMKLLLAWMAIHEDELQANWELLSNGDGYFRIDPLR